MPQSNATSSYLLLLEFAPSVGVQLTDRLSIGATMFIGDGYASGPFVGTRIGPIEVPGGIPSVKYLQSQFAIINEHRIAGGLGVEDFLMQGLDFDAFAGGMLPAGDSLGDSTYVSVASYWIGVGFTWHFGGQAPPRSPS